MNKLQHIKFKQAAYKACYSNVTNVDDVLQQTYLNLLESDVDMETPKAYIGLSIFNNSRRLHVVNSKYVEFSTEMHSCLTNESSMPNYYSDDYLVREAIEALPLMQRRTVESFMKLNKLSDVAKHLKVNYDTTKANYRHAMLKIKVYLLDHDYTPDKEF
jgi:hypothetical protein